MQTVKRFFSRLEKTNTILFVIYLALIGMLIKIPGSMIGDYIVSLFGIHNPMLSSDAQIPKITGAEFIMVVIFAPLIETLIGQALPLAIAARTKAKNSTRIVISAATFSLLHLPVLGFLLGAFLLGLILAWAYVVKRKYGRWKAFFIVASVHAIHNALAFGAAFLYINSH